MSENVRKCIKIKIFSFFNVFEKKKLARKTLFEKNTIRNEFYNNFVETKIKKIPTEIFQREFLLYRAIRNFQVTET